MAPPPKTARSPWTRALHAIGYVATAIVAIQLLFLAYMTVPEWWRDRQRSAAARDDTRTHVGSLAERPSDQVSDWMVGLLDTLPKKPTHASDSIHIAIAPSLSGRSYAVGLTAAPARNGVVDVDYVIVTEDLCDVRKPVKIERRNFALSKADYRVFEKWFDTTTATYRGSDEGWLDGTVVAFERRKTGTLTSGVGNIPGHYGLLATRLHALIEPHLDGLAIPAGTNWHSTAPDSDCTS